MLLPQSAICAIPAIATAALPRVPYQTHLGGYGSQLLIGLRLFVRLSSQLIRSCHSAIGQSRPLGLAMPRLQWIVETPEARYCISLKNGAALVGGKRSHPVRPL
jgi:hypothetical protein